jgi:hypothetical protein
MHRTTQGCADLRAAPRLARALLMSAAMKNGPSRFTSSGSASLAVLAALVSLVSMASLACSASSSGGGAGDLPKTDAGAGVESGSGSGGSGSSSGGDSTPKTIVCMGGGGCADCCMTNYLGGAQLYRLTEVDCACTGAGSCVDACSAAECSELRSTDHACQVCLDERVKTTCDAMAASACAGDATCKAYLACLNGC